MSIDARYFESGPNYQRLQELAEAKANMFYKLGMNPHNLTDQYICQIMAFKSSWIGSKQRKWHVDMLKLIRREIRKHPKYPRTLDKQERKQAAASEILKREPVRRRKVRRDYNTPAGVVNNWIHYYEQNAFLQVWIIEADTFEQAHGILAKNYFLNTFKNGPVWRSNVIFKPWTPGRFIAWQSGGLHK